MADPTAPVDRWHLSRDGQRQGPYAWAQIEQMARAGHLRATDSIWQEGTPGWLPLPSRLTVGPAPPPAAATESLKTRLLFHAHRAVEWNLRTTPVTAAETEKLISIGVDDEDARRYHAWRRSVLWAIAVAGGLAALFGFIDAVAATDTNLNAFGGFLEFVRVASLFAMPAFAFLAARDWWRHARSRRFLAIGWTVAFGAPLVLALFPVHWRFAIGEGEARIQQEAMLRIVGAVGYYITLMPAVLALVPGILRACLRIKVLLPQSIVPGWFLVAVAPFWIFLFLVVFATVNQVAGDAMLILGVLAVAGAPSLYLVHVALFTRPILSDEDQRRVLNVQRQVRIILTVGVVFLVIWLFTTELFGKSIIGVDADKSFVRPWSLDLIKFPIEFASHSLCTMALAADLFMAMNLSVWKHTKAFVGSAAAADYDRRMREVEEGGS